MEGTPRSRVLAWRRMAPFLTTRAIEETAGLRLRLAQRQPEADAVDGVGVLAALQGVSRPTPADFFTQHLGQAGFGDDDAFGRLDLADEARQRPVGAVGDGRFEQWRRHSQRRFGLDRGNAAPRPSRRRLRATRP